MSLKQASALVAIAWLIGAVIAMARSIRRGRALADELARRHPEAYEALGRPCPGYLYSVRRDRFAQFVAARDYEGLGDPALALEFEAYRTTEARLVVGVLVSMLAVGVLLLTVQRTA